MWKALLILTLVGLFLGGSLMTLKYTARLGVPRTKRRILPATTGSEAGDSPSADDTESAHPSPQHPQRGSDVT